MTENTEATRTETEVSAPAAVVEKAEKVTKDSGEGKSLKGNLRDNFRAGSEKVKEKLTQPEVVKDKVESKKEIPQVVEPVKSQVQVAPILPPSDMSPAEKEAFAKLSPDQQSYISRRAYQYQSDHTRKIHEIQQREKRVQALDEVLSPVRDEYAKAGINEVDLVRRSLAWDKAFKTNKVAAAREFLDAYGVDIKELSSVEPTNDTSNFLTREEAEKLADERAQRLFDQQAQSSIAEQAYHALQSFLASKPLFRDPGTGQQLENDMAPIVAGLRNANPQRPVTEILNEAYELVTKGKPVYSELVSKLTARSDAERANAEAVKAEAASRSISGGPGSGTPKIKTKDIRENLRLRMNGAR